MKVKTINRIYNTIKNKKIEKDLKNNFKIEITNNGIGLVKQNENNIINIKLEIISYIFFVNY